MNVCIALATMYVVDVNSADIIAKGGDDHKDGNSGDPSLKGEKDSVVCLHFSLV